MTNPQLMEAAELLKKLSVVLSADIGIIIRSLEIEKIFNEHDADSILDLAILRKTPMIQPDQTTETSSTSAGDPLRMFHPPEGHTPEEYFVFYFNWLQAKAHLNAKDKGFWDDNRSDGESIALIHSEISEALEGLRNGNPPDDKVPQHGNAETELGDAVIRIMDLAGKKGWNVAQAMIDKMIFNAARPYKHGRRF